MISWKSTTTREPQSNKQYSIYRHKSIENQQIPKKCVRNEEKMQNDRWKEIRKTDGK